MSTGTGKLSVSYKTASTRNWAETRRKKNNRISAKMRRRMDEVAQMLSTMIPHAKIEQRLAEKWGVKRHTVSAVIDKVYEEWRDTSGHPDFVNKLRDQLRQNWQMLYMKSMSKGDEKTASYCLRELGQLHGAYADKSINMNVKGGIGVGLGLSALGFNSPEEVRNRIDELRELVENHGPEAIGRPTQSMVTAALNEASKNGSNGTGQIIDVEADDESDPT